MKVSIIIPCYNYGRFVADAINSALNQTYQNIEIIVVNDGSTDNSDEVIRTFGDKIIYINQKNQGLSQSRNNSIPVATGEYIISLDADDWIAPEYIQDAVSLIEDEYTIVSPLHTYTDKNLCITGGNWPNEHTINTNNNTVESILITNRIAGPSMFSKKCWEKVGGHDNKIPFCEDWLFWIEMISIGCKTVYLKNGIVHHKYRKHGPSMLSSMPMDLAIDYIYKKYGIFKLKYNRRDKIIALYQLILNRNPDLFGLKNYLKSNLSISDIRNDLFMSNEYKNKHKK